MNQYTTLPQYDFLETPVPTPTGWKTLGTLSQRDMVFAEDGHPVRITSASRILHGEPCYRVTFADDPILVLAENHRLFTWTHAARKEFGRRGVDACRVPSFASPQQIASTLTYGTRRDTNHSVRICDPLQYREANLPIDPYLLGLWLGDGSSFGGQIYTQDAEIVQAFRILGYEVVKVQDTYGYSVKGFGGKTVILRRADGSIRGGTCLTTQLRLLGLLRNKHIPPQYLHASVKQRQALLMGLMDTDGTCSTGGSCSFDNTNQALAAATEELAISLGLKVGTHTRPARLNGKDCGTCYAVTFTPQIPVFRLQRKFVRQRLAEVKATQYQRYIIDVSLRFSDSVRYFGLADGCTFLVGHSCIPVAMGV